MSPKPKPKKREPPTYITEGELVLKKTIYRELKHFEINPNEYITNDAEPIAGIFRNVLKKPGWSFEEGDEDLDIHFPTEYEELAREVMKEKELNKILLEMVDSFKKEKMAAKIAKKVNSMGKVGKKRTQQPSQKPITFKILKNHKSRKILPSLSFKSMPIQRICPIRIPCTTIAIINTDCKTAKKFQAKQLRHVLKLQSKPRKPNSQPKKLQSQPQKLQSRPQRPQSQPKQNRSRPQQLQSKPKQHQSRPQSQPKQNRSRPQQLRSKPKQHQSRPQSQPKQHRSRPQQLRSKPKQHQSRPQSQPKQHRSRPQQLQSRPKQHRSRPQQLRSKPQQLQSNPQQIQSNPQQLQSNPQQIQSQPQQLQSQPQQQPQTQQNLPQSSKVVVNNNANQSHEIMAPSINRPPAPVKAPTKLSSIKSFKEFHPAIPIKSVAKTVSLQPTVPVQPAPVQSVPVQPMTLQPVAIPIQSVSLGQVTMQQVQPMQYIPAQPQFYHHQNFPQFQLSAPHHIHPHPHHPQSFLPHPHPHPHQQPYQQPYPQQYQQHYQPQYHQQQPQYIYYQPQPQPLPLPQPQPQQHDQHHHQHHQQQHQHQYQYQQQQQQQEHQQLQEQQNQEQSQQQEKQQEEDYTNQLHQQYRDQLHQNIFIQDTKNKGSDFLRPPWERNPYRLNPGLNQKLCVDDFTHISNNPYYHYAQYLQQYNAVQNGSLVGFKDNDDDNGTKNVKPTDKKNVQPKK